MILFHRRSSCQHPLIAGALGRIAEDQSVCEMMTREEGALQQLVSRGSAGYMIHALHPHSKFLCAAHLKAV